MDGMLWPTTAPAPTFHGFGPSDYLGEEPRLHLLEAAMGQREVRQRIRALCPPLPGVYGMLDSPEQLLREVARDYWFVYPVPTGAGRSLWNLVAGGDVVEVVPQPCSSPEAEALAALLAATYARRDGQLHLSVETLARVQLVVSWFRQHPEELGKVISPDQAANCCRVLPGTRRPRQLRSGRS